MYAPVSGGKIDAETKNMIIMVGGDVEIYQYITSIFSAFRDKVFYAGSIGAGSVSKLITTL